jgi:hypothetical protein
MDPMNDLDRELTAVLRVEPSPEFAARVRARIATEPGPARWRMPRLALAAAGVAIAVLAVNVISSRPESTRPAGAPMLPHQSFAAIAPLAVAPPSIAPRRASRGERYVMPSDVQVSTSEMLALRRLFSGEIVAPPAGELPVEVVIAPIALDAISMPAIPEGERQ